MTGLNVARYSDAELSSFYAEGLPFLGVITDEANVALAGTRVRKGEPQSEFYANS